jgi:hypothetical protein
MDKYCGLLLNHKKNVIVLSWKMDGTGDHDFKLGKSS